MLVRLKEKAKKGMSKSLKIKLALQGLITVCLTCGIWHMGYSTGATDYPGWFVLMIIADFSIMIWLYLSIRTITHPPIVKPSRAYDYDEARVVRLDRPKTDEPKTKKTYDLSE